MKCEYCGSDIRSDEGGVSEWECGSHQPWNGEVQRTVECLARADARYRAMFPVAPWDDGPITAEVCERLGMVRTSEEDDIGMYSAHAIDVEFTNIGPEIWMSPVGYSGPPVKLPEEDRTAGQLACLVAARKSR